MKLISMILISVAAIGTLKAQSYFHQRIGPFDYWSGSNGYYGSGQQIGPFYYYHDNYGNGFGQQIGPYHYYHYTPNFDEDDDE